VGRLPGQQVNGQEDVFYPTTVTYNGRQLITAAVPAGAEFPLSLDFLDFLVINPSETLTGDAYVADLQRLCSPRPPVTPPYTPIPGNPPWLRYAVGATEQLSATGTTPAGDDLSALQVPIADPASHLWSSSDPGVAAVDPRTGVLTARSPGTATISVLSGGVTGSVTVTVSQ
jgi:hypothetical protein